MNEAEIQVLTNIYQSHYAMVVGIAWRYAPVPDLILDIAQQVYLDFVENAGKHHWDLHRDSAPLLATLTKNRAIKIWKQEQPYLPEGARKIAERLAKSSAPSPKEIELLEDRTEALEDCMNRLGRRGREMIRNRYFDNQTIETIARQWSLKPASVRKSLTRIRQELKDCIDRKQDD